MNYNINELNLFSKEINTKLRNLGVRTIFDFILLPNETLNRFEINKDDCLDQIKKRDDFVNLINTGTEIISKKEKRRTISLGSLTLNRMLNGGIKTGYLTDFFGASKTGKTQICFQLCIFAQLLERPSKVVFVDTVGTFRPERIKEIVKSMNLDINVFDNISIVKARSAQDQINLLQKIKKIVPFDISLLLIDNLTDNFIYEYHGEKQIIDRQSDLAKYLHRLSLFAIRENIAIVLTNTVRTRIKNDQCYEVETGGNVVSQGTHIRIHLMHEKDHIVAKLIQPLTDKRDAHFKINFKGIVDYGTNE